MRAEVPTEAPLANGAHDDAVVVTFPLTVEVVTVKYPKFKHAETQAEEALVHEVHTPEFG